MRIIDDISISQFALNQPMTDQELAFQEIYLQQYKDSEPAVRDYILPHLTFQYIKKSGFYLSYGDIQTEMGYVSEGLLRRYYINDNM